MLCCGLLTLIAASLAGLWRWLRPLPRGMVAVVGILVLASPALALSLIHSATLNRAGVIERATQSLCGRR